LIAAYLNIHSTDRELQDLFVQLLISLQPRLSGELGELKAALESEPADLDILDRDPASAPPGAHLIGDLAAEQDRLGRAIKTGKLDDFLPSSSSDQDAPPAAGGQSEPYDSGRAGSSSPMGQFFDHGCDALTTVCEMMKIGASLHLGNSLTSFLLVFYTSVGFVLTSY
jgi:hypothetical protein